jgi:hypothetical protein
LSIREILFDVRKKRWEEESGKKGNVMEERAKEKSTKGERMIRNHWR